MALFQCVIAALVAAGVAVQPEAPVRRHREAAQTTSSQDYDEALDEQVGDDDVQSSALVASQPLPDAQDCPLGRRGRRCRRAQCPLIAKRRSGKYAAGNCGEDKCPEGYETITDSVTCEDAANELGLKWFPDGKERGRKNQANVCNFCGGCGRRDGFRSVRIDDNHFGVANFICIKKASCKSEGQYTAYSNGDWVNQLNTAVSRASTTGDGYYAWCNLYGCPQFNSQASAWCNSGGNRACRNQCEALPGGPFPNGGRNGVCTRYGAPSCSAPLAAATTWVFDPYNTTSHRSSCDTVCQQRTGGTCDQAAFAALTDDASVIAAYTSAGFTCNSNTALSHNCEPNNCQSWGAPYLHNSHMGGASAGICFGGTPSNGNNRVATCGQSPVDGWHRRLCPCSVASL